MLAKPAKDMTMREEVAKAAMEGLLASGSPPGTALAENAVAQADRLVTELAKPKEA